MSRTAWLAWLVVLILVAIAIAGGQYLLSTRSDIKGSRTSEVVDGDAEEESSSVEPKLSQLPPSGDTPSKSDSSEQQSSASPEAPDKPATGRKSRSEVHALGGFLPFWLGSETDVSVFPETTPELEAEDIAAFRAQIVADVDLDWAKEHSAKMVVEIWELKPGEWDGTAHWEPRPTPTISVPYSLPAAQRFEIPYKVFGDEPKYLRITAHWREEEEDHSEIVWKGVTE